MECLHHSVDMRSELNDLPWASTCLLVFSCREKACCVLRPGCIPDFFVNQEAIVYDECISYMNKSLPKQSELFRNAPLVLYVQFVSLALLRARVGTPI